jgi:pimeloyl-ACP methyl ester carboxylesterase
MLIFIAVVLAIFLALAGLPMLISTTPLPGLAAPHELATPDSHFVTIPFEGTDGIELHYLAGGREDGPGASNFLLLHGFTFNAFTWNDLLEAFGEHGRVVAYDQPPYGLSAKLVPSDWRGAGPYTREAAVVQLFALMDALAMERAVLVGNSAGGSLALEAALARPDRIEGLILLDPWVYVRRPTLPRALASQPQFARLSIWLARALGRSDALLRRSYADPARITPERRRLSGIHAQVHNWDLAWGALLHRSLTDAVAVSARLDEIARPTLVLSGAEDRLVPLSDSERVVASIPGASLAVLPGCGHMPQEECPALVREALSAWLSDQKILREGLDSR